MRWETLPVSSGDDLDDLKEQEQGHRHGQAFRAMRLEAGLGLTATVHALELTGGDAAAARELGELERGRRRFAGRVELKHWLDRLWRLRRCTEAECTDPVVAGEKCHAHYQQLRRKGATAPKLGPHGRKAG